ncbi:hypothetical protein ACX0HA_01850 [Flavobacterium hauense]
MKLRPQHRLCLLLLLVVSCVYAQDGTTVFVTGEIKKEKKEKTPFFGEAGAFSNFSISVPLRGNDSDYEPEEDISWFAPDGISLHGGFGVHSTETIAFSINTGIDGMISKKLVAAPVYGSLLFNPKVGDETTLTLQAGVGWGFALGRGDLSGLYQKYRLGFANGDNMGIFIEANIYNFELYNATQVGSLNLGICLFNFE